MKRLLLFLIVPTLALAQGPYRVAVNQPARYAVQLDGTSQYLSKSSPSSMDLNGSEILSNTTWEVNTTGWTLAAKATRTSDQAHGGSYSIADTGGTLETTWIYQTLSPTISGYKVTAEAWCYVVSAAGGRPRLVLLDAGSVTLAQAYADTSKKNQWQKVVINYNAAVGNAIKYFELDFSATSGLCYWDDPSLTQAYDALLLARVKRSGTTTYRDLLRVRAGTLNYKLGTGTTGENLFVCYMHDGTTALASNYSAGFPYDGQWHLWAGQIVRTGTTGGVSYFDGKAGTAVNLSTLGKLSGADGLLIGENSAGILLDATVGELLVIRFDALPSDIASWIAYASTQRFIPDPPAGGTVVLKLLGKENSFRDQSGTQGILTNNGNAQTTRY